MVRLLFFLLIAWPFIKWALALRYPAILKRLEGKRSQARLELQWGAGRKDERVSKIGGELMRANGLRAVFRVLDGEPVNAVALPHGRIFVWEGLLRFAAEDEAMLAGVLAHELGHLAKEHYLAGVRRAAIFQFVLGMWGGGWFRSMMRNMGSQIVARGFDRLQEEEADDAAVRYLVKAGYDPAGLARLFEALARSGGKGGGFLGTHPAPLARARRILARLGTPDPQSRTGEAAEISQL